MPKDLQIFSIYVLPYLLEIAFFLFTLKLSELEKNYEKFVENRIFFPTPATLP